MEHNLVIVFSDVGGRLCVADSEQEESAYG